MAVTSVKVVLHTAQIGHLARSESMFVHLRVIAEKIRNSAGDGFAVKELRAGKRARVLVYTRTHAAKVAESSSRVLTRAVANGR